MVLVSNSQLSLELRATAFQSGGFSFLGVDLEKGENKKKKKEYWLLSRIISVEDMSFLSGDSWEIFPFVFAISY